MSTEDVPATSLAELLADEPVVTPDALQHSEHADLNADPAVDYVEDADESERPADQGGTGAVVDPAAPAAAAPAGDKAETPPVVTTPAAASPETGPKWFRDEIKRQQALTKAAEDRAAALETRQAQAQPEEDDDDLPDPFENPKEFAKAVTAKAEAKVTARVLLDKINTSVNAFVEDEGLDTWKEIDLWLGTPAGAAVAAKSRASLDPARYCQKEYKKVLATEEIGDDPVAYEAKVRERVRAELLAEQAASTEQTPAPVTAEKPAAAKPRLPGPAGQEPSAAPRKVDAGPTPLGSLMTFKS